MSDLSSKTCAVYDHDNNVELARVLARTFGTVYYYSPWKKFVPRDLDLLPGHGFEEITRVENFFETEVMKSDLFVFPYIYDGDLQEYLRGQGKLVWGSGQAEILETNRGFFFDTLERIGLPVPPHERIRGISELRKYLSENGNLWIKTSKFRGSASGETWHHQNIIQSQGKLDQIAYELGPFQEDKLFYCCEHIDTPIEGGGDFFIVDGESSQETMQGFEKKDSSYIATHLPYTDIPEPIREVNDAIAPVLREFRMRGPISTEIKIEGDKPWWIDATLRVGSPPGELVQEWITNLGEMIYEAAKGNLIEPEFLSPFACQVAVYSNWQATNFQPFEINESKRHRLKLYGCCQRKKTSYVVPSQVLNSPWLTEEHSGYVLGFGKTIEDMISDLDDNLESLKAFETTNRRDTLADLLKEIRESEKRGLIFTEEQEIPEPSTVIDD